MSTIEQAPTAERAQAYVALLSMFGVEVEPKSLGTCVEKWALFMTGADVPKPALIAALRPVAERCPVVSLIRACVMLDLDIRDVMGEVIS